MIGLLLPLTFVQAAVIQVRVSTDSDDAEQRSNNSVSTTSSDLEMMHDGRFNIPVQDAVGIRFQNITIPQGATINSAFIEFTADESHNRDTRLRIFGQNSDDTATFSSANNNITNRPRTSNSVFWQLAGWGTGNTYQTPDITSIIQEVVDRGGWSSGNSMAVLIYPNFDCVNSNCKRVAESYEGSSGNAPLLVIDYNDVVTPPPATCVVNARDNFDVQSFSNNDGYFNWADAWTEYDNAGTGPASGKVRITGGELVLDNYTGGEWNGSPGVDREVDLSGYTSATLNFDYQLLGGVDNDDWFRVRVSSDGGSSWDRTWDIQNIGDGSYTFSEDITPYMSANTVISIRIHDQINAGACCYGATNERIEIDFVEVLTDEICGSVAEWRFDELSWNSTTGEVIDDTGNGLNGTAMGGANTSFADPPGPAIVGDPGTCRFGDFNGTSTYVEVPDNNLLDIDQTLTVSTWINPNRYPSSGLMSILSKDENYEFHLQPSGVVNWWWNNSSGATRQFNSTAAVPLNAWTHVAIVYSQTEQIIYINGVASGSTSYTSELLRTNNDPLQIGDDQLFGGGSRRFDGYIDEVRVYDFALSATDVQTIMNDTHPCGFGPTLGWIEITAGSAASTCAPHAVTITAYDSDPAFNPGALIFTNYTGTVVLTTLTGHGNWSINTANGILNPNPHTTDNGQATYTFVSADQGSVVLNLSNVHADDLRVSAADISIGNPFYSPDISFRDNAFVITPVTCTGTTCPATGSTELVAGRDHVFNAALWRRDPATGDCAIATGYDTSGNAAFGDLKAWINRDAADPLGIAPQIDGTALGNVAPVGNNLDLSFTNGQAQFILNTFDVGKYDLSLRDDTSGFALDDQGNDDPADDVPRPISGSSDSLTVRPFALGYSNINKNGTPNPSGTATSGAGFVAAGDTFAATVGAYLWQEADDGNNDGLVDDPTTDDVTDNVLTPAYNFTTRLSVDNTGGFTPLPLTGVAGALGGTTAPNGFAGGSQIINDLTYTEVGSMRLLANATDYLGTVGVNVYGQTPDNAPVGRFYPHHFELGGVTITEACGAGGFTYMDQDELQLQYTLVAQNLGNSTTSNYFTAGYTTGTVTAVAENNNVGNDLSSRLSNTGSANWVGGQYIINVTNAQFDRAATPDGPFDNLQLGVFVTDLDGAEIQNRDMKPDDTTVCTAMTCTARSLGATMVRYGRMAMTNAHGSELLPLSVNTFMQYYDGTFFVSNNLDTCTALAITDVDLSNNEQANERDGTITINGATVTATVQNSPANNGALNIDLTAPGTGNTGYVDIQPDLSTVTGADLSWLLFDWDGDAGTANQAPVGRATFGIFGGNPQQIYMQEIY